MKHYLLAVLCLMVAGAIPAVADSITYNYTGSDFTDISCCGDYYTTSQFITASVTLASPLAPNSVGIYNLVSGGTCIDFCGDVLSWSISDQNPADNLSSANGNFLNILTFATNAQGQIDQWELDAWALNDPGHPDSYPQLHTNGETSPSVGYFDQSFVPGNLAYSQGPGSWVESDAGASVPEPATLGLLFAGLAAGALKRRRPKKRP